MTTRIRAIQGDITKVKSDAIVNAANSSLLGGGGVDGAIHRAGGPTILEECMAIRGRQGGCPTGEAVITTGGNLPAKYVIHTVGPVWNGGRNKEPELLAACYRNALNLAVSKDLHSIAFPNISTGIYGYPKDKAAAIAVATVKQYLAAHDAREPHNAHLEDILFVCFDRENFILYEGLLRANP